MASVGNNWNPLILSLCTIAVVFGFPVLGQATPVQEDSTPQGKPLHHLIEQLADEDFATRQAAESRLLDQGITVLPQLKIQRQATDQELRLRIHRIIEMIRLREMDDAVVAFLKGQASLPGWDTYSAGTGDDDLQREAFVKLYRQRKATLDRHQNDEDQIGLLKELLEEFSDREVRRPAFDDSLLTCLSMQLSKTLPKVDAQAELPLIRSTLTKYFTQAAFGEMVSDSNRLKNLHREAVIQWIQLPDPEISEMVLRVTLAQTLKIPEGLAVALEYLKRPEAGQSRSIDYALKLVAHYGDESHIPLLETHLDNTLVLYNSRFVEENEGRTSVYKAQAKDQALATILHLAGLKYRDFGLNLRKESFQGQPLPSRHSGFLNSENREAAHKKWRDFRRTANSKNPH
ncbi:MAG: hypothetical protein GY819_03640 [Planctomycetaceae bacterium]|nr:hypothetical protein [Planctomycetaceae bacterium]MCP4461876.1 hypothetical protein [Planctomycetaceae bacterium]MDG1809717.1 hypothetical protein [Pirellulaceae bacterium]MDG2103159.1 hypothetical protein [Pirellulaceae bacterium]